MRKLIVGILLVGLPILLVLILMHSYIIPIIALFCIVGIVLIMLVSISMGMDLLSEWESEMTK